MLSVVMHASLLFLFAFLLLLLSGGGRGQGVAESRMVIEVELGGIVMLDREGLFTGLSV